MDSKQRGLEIKRRRLLAGITTPSEFADAVGIDRGTVKRAENGDARESTLDRLEAWLDQFEHETSSDREDAERAARQVGAATEKPDLAPGLIEFELTGNFGVRVVARAHAGNSAELEEAVERIVDHMRRPQGE